ncbi:hypothetical protein TSAR_000110, partial [Trichomalopsis sarcophagae]
SKKIFVYHTNLKITTLLSILRLLCYKILYETVAGGDFLPLLEVFHTSETNNSISNSGLSAKSRIKYCMQHGIKVDFISADYCPREKSTCLGSKPTRGKNMLPSPFTAKIRKSRPFATKVILICTVRLTHERSECDKHGAKKDYSSHR